ncbi:hypothetical protein PMZ80_006037 [Knufia obscura]|uniref:BRCT domain-containing protein n=1 Tax=Knufia obscura TaxID=1635080 RepID=A0ABR0RPR2_9EURO|nr:hypothetical protein PMZ80_006037 [Knufia obscura]
MPPYQHPSLPKAPQSTRVFFDPFNSSATGHQRAENRLSGSTSWRDSRKHKLGHQFRDTTGGGGQKHLSDLVGAGSENFGKDGRKENGDWELGAPGLRSDGWQDIRGILGGSKKRSSDAVDDIAVEKKRRVSSEPVLTKSVAVEAAPGDGDTSALMSGREEKGEEGNSSPPQIFRGLTMYLNGSTMPLVSDHGLKQLWVQHGGDASINLGRRTVTHVILGEKGAGGGLAATKIQKENVTIRGKGIKYVSAQWVLDSIEKGIRQPESRYAAADVKNKLGGSGQASVATLFRAKTG